MRSPGTAFLNGRDIARALLWDGGRPLPLPISSTPEVLGSNPGATAPATPEEPWFLFTASSTVCTVSPRAESPRAESPVDYLSDNHSGTA